jgi:tetratricopeptide (TPR) repeat protein
MIKIFIFSWIFFVSINSIPSYGEVAQVDRFYLDGQFSRVVEYFEKKEYLKLSQPEKLLFIESLARTSRGLQALDRLKPLLEEQSPDSAVLATAAAVYLSLGKLDRAQTEVDRALTLQPGNNKAILTRVLLLLYRQQFSEAKQQYEKLAGQDREWSDSELLFLVGLDVYRASRDPRGLSELYKTHAQRVKKTNKRYYEILKANARMYKHAGQNRLFQVETGAGRVVVSFAAAENAPRLNTIPLTLKGKTFKVLLDTGNATGLLVHSRELNELLKPKTGGRTVTGIGTESGMLDGYRQYYPTVDFNAFKILHVNGIYVPRPHPDFPDANLNPAWLRNRVVTMDFVKNQLVLQGKEQFAKELSLYPEERYTSLPWYGYKFPYIPVKVKDKQGLAVIETGAEDIALKLDFAEGLGLQLIPQSKYLANGQVFKYYHAAVTLSVGSFLFQRREAEVWPLDRFFNHLSGLAPEVVLGPAALLRGRFEISFDPFANQVIFLTPE